MLCCQQSGSEYSEDIFEPITDGSQHLLRNGGGLIDCLHVFIVKLRILVACKINLGGFVDYVVARTEAPHRPPSTQKIPTVQLAAVRSIRYIY